ncbi:glutathione S-transferase [Antarctobacter heliothermus]|uniref:Glutathione S-transferase n=1 Tax=Antarctobacter heliothermus TaxID=74033 RepID=A0A239C1K5_9RHOB|nr:glutathione S-transferase [Antarctobacter heliothermus]SNS14185.1 glutathione S-transferase [Antarctobacter heliothermus]
MAQKLFLGDYSYSSWSLRAWLLFRRFDIPVGIELIDFMKAGVAEQMAAMVPTRTVPTLVTEEGTVIWDSLAIAEELNDRHPEASLWPADPALRALSRGLASEMHSSFGTLRELCPMNLRAAYAETPVPDGLQADLARLEVLWTHALDVSGGPWLCGEYSVADAFYAPVSARIAGYALPVSDRLRAYVDAHLADPAFRRWRAMGLARGATLPWYDRDYAKVPWPGPAPRIARPVDTGTAENTACPYSGDPVTHLMETEGRVFGFCNAFCRDKTVNDPDAWPQFVALRDGTGAVS